MSNLREQILDSVKSHAIGHINKHKMNVEVYLTNPAGIGEHPDVLEAIEQELKVIAEYEDQLEIISKYFEIDS
jgi:septum formation topological specificity factor MinE